MKKGDIYSTPLGMVGIAEENGKITNIFFGNTVKPAQYITERTAVTDQAAEEITAYLNGTLQEFTVPYVLVGTEFEKKVWAELVKIPYGQITSYGAIAEALGKPTACRAVGMANGRNPVSIIVPCHRVIGKSGKLTGYAGGLPMKEALLKLEGIAFKKT